jgi:hypothetical protein
MATQLFSDIPASAKNIPGSVTPNISADIRPNVDWSQLAAMYALQRRMKEDRAGDWARAAAVNNARAAAQSQPQESYLPPTASQTSGMGYGQSPTGQGPVMWAPRNLQGPKLGTWASQQQNRALAENREMPIVLQAHANDPFSPGEVGGGGASNVLGRGIYGPGLTSTMGGANPYIWAKMWGGGGGGGGGGGVGGTRQAGSVSPFPKESLRERTSPGPQYQYDMWGGR